MLDVSECLTPWPHLPGTFRAQAFSLLNFVLSNCFTSNVSLIERFLIGFLNIQTNEEHQTVVYIYGKSKFNFKERMLVNERSIVKSGLGV